MTEFESIVAAVAVERGRAHGEWFNLDADVERLLNEWVAGSIPAAPTINRR